MTDVEHRVRDPVVADEAPHHLVGKERDRLGGVRDREAVLADEHRQQHGGVLGEPRCDHGQVVGLLRVLGEELDHPESRISIESEWSQWMLIGPERARLPSAITIGARIEAAM